MNLRKINAVLGLLTTALLLGHAVSLAAWMLSRGSIAKPENIMPWVLTGLAAVHALLCIGLMISAYKADGKQPGRNYPKRNIPTIVQRVSGVLLILFTGLHVAGAAGYMQPPQVVHAIVPPLFFFIALSHTAVSTGKAFITLGIGNARFFKAADIAIKAICAAILIADVVGFYLHVC